MNPKNDMFISTSRDYSLKIWNLNSDNSEPEGFLDLTEKKSIPTANFDPSGLVFAVCHLEPKNESYETFIRLYDCNNYKVN